MTYVDGKDLEFCENLTLINRAAYKSCTKVVSITIPASVAEIAGEAFYACGNLKMVIIKNCATIIGPQAFYGASETFQSICIRTRFFTAVPDYVNVNIPRMTAMSLAAGIISSMLF